MMRGPALRMFADEHGLAMISIADLIRYRRRYESHVRRIAVTRLPTAEATFQVHAYRDVVTGAEHVALVWAISPKAIRSWCGCIPNA